MIFLSPGVKTREVDFSTYVGQVSTCIVGLVGGAKRGAINKATLITSPSEYVEVFGEPLATDFGGLTALEYLKQGNQLYYVRVAEGTAAFSEATIAGGKITVQGKEKGSFFDRIAIAHTPIPTDGGVFQILVYKDGFQEEGFDASLDPDSEYFIENLKSVWVDFIFNEIDETAPELTELKLGTTPFVQNANNEWEVILEGDASVPTGITGKTNTGVGSPVVKVVSDTSNTPLTEGDDFGVASATSDGIGIVFSTEDLPLAEALSTTTAAIPEESHFEYTAITPTTADPSTELNEDGTAGLYETSDGTNYTQTSDTTVDSGKTYYSRKKVIDQAAVPEVTTPGHAWTKKFEVTLVSATGVETKETFVIKAVDAGESTVVTPGSNTDGPSTPAVPVEYLPAVTDPVYLAGGNDGCPLRYQTVIGSGTTGLQAFRNAEDLDVNLIAAPGFYEAQVVNELINIAETRADCMAILATPQGLNKQQAIAYHNGTLEGENMPKKALNSSYAAMYYPWVEIYDTYSGENRWMPPEGVVLAAYAYNDREGQPWFAPAGLNRGMLNSVLDVEVSLDEGARDALYGNGNVINSIVNYKKQGITVWGQRTMQRKNSALDRVNVRRLMNMARKSIAASTAYLVFEAIDPLTWRRWTGMIEPYLENIKQSRGLYDYMVQMDETTVTDYYKDRNEMPGRVYLKPTKTAEFIPIDFILTASGAQFSS